MSDSEPKESQEPKTVPVDESADRVGLTGDEAPPAEPSSGENVCPACEGSGLCDDESCTKCGGSGRINEAVGGG